MSDFYSTTECDVGIARLSDPSVIELRPLEEHHIDEEYLSWFRDDAVTYYLEARNITREEALAHLIEGRVRQSFQLYGIWHVLDRAHIGNVKLGPINHRHGVGDCVTVIGRKGYWGRGYATLAIRKAITIAFEELGLRKLSAGVIDGNVGSISAYTKAGFVVEGRLKGQYLLKGQAVDRIQIGCFNPKYFDAE